MDRRKFETAKYSSLRPHLTRLLEIERESSFAAITSTQFVFGNLRRSNPTHFRLLSSNRNSTSSSESCHVSLPPSGCLATLPQKPRARSTFLIWRFSIIYDVTLRYKKESYLLFLWEFMIPSRRWRNHGNPSQSIFSLSGLPRKIITLIPVLKKGVLDRRQVCRNFYSQALRKFMRFSWPTLTSNIWLPWQRSGCLKIA